MITIHLTPIDQEIEPVVSTAHPRKAHASRNSTPLKRI